MKKSHIIILCFLLLISCNINPSKEERIQNLEKEVEVLSIKLNDIEQITKNLETHNKQLNNKIKLLESH